MSLGQRTIDHSPLKPPFQIYSELLKKWNKAYNLTAITDDREIAIKHFEDSLAPLSLLPRPCRLLDIGCGAGFPGIPLKMERSDLEVVLLDSVRKKISFCEAVIRELKLRNIKAIHGRAQDKDIIEALGKFDVVITRATFSVNNFLSLAHVYLKETGVVIAMKGPEWKEEKLHGGYWELMDTVDYELSDQMGKRSLLFFKSKSRRM